MKEFRIAFLGFGNVGQALARLLLRKQDELQRDYGLTFRITGISTGSHGTRIDPNGLDLEQALAAVSAKGSLGEALDGLSFVQTCPADVVFESIPVNYLSGQPAVDYLRAALSCKIHAITANKGPVVHAYQELTALAAKNGCKFYFESAVMDGAPIFSLFRETLPGARLISIHGILNSTTNLILGRMEAGESLDQAIAYAQSIGIAETDPSGDVDGWDAAVKVAALSTVLMGVPLLPKQVTRTGIRAITPEQIRQASQSGKRWKLVCSLVRQGDGVLGRVVPQMVGSDSPLYNVQGTSSVATFVTDVLPELSIVEGNPGTETTAYGMLADFINIAKKP